MEHRSEGKSHMTDVSKTDMTFVQVYPALRAK
jgi:hypothetical protein